MGVSDTVCAPDPYQHPIRPMLASEGGAPSGSAWAFEFEWDGLRTIAYLRPGRVQLLSAESERPITAGYPELAPLAALAEGRGELVLDGKLVAMDDRGLPSVTPLRKRMSTPRPSPSLVERVPVRYYASDVLHIDGRSTMSLPYRRRRELLAELDLSGLPADVTPYFLDADGRTMLDVAGRFGLGGVLAKRLDSRYQPGRRSRAWVRTSPRHSQRVVVGGWLPGGRTGGEPGGALLVGVPEPAGLRYVGRVTAGLDQRARRALAGPLDELVCPASPFREPPPEQHTRGVRWVAPRLVGEVTFRRRESDGVLRHASWVGLVADGQPAALGTRAPAAASAAVPAPRSPSGTAGDTAGANGTAPELAELGDAVRLAQAEVRALRAQISPHFVYNALTTIAAFVRTDPPRARELLAEFAEYARYSFRPSGPSKPPASTLGAELANVERYLALEQARFGERLRVSLRVDDGLHRVEVPFLAVQPLVELAVRHGIEGTPRGGTVRVTATAEGEDCVVTVSEDVGVPAERLDEVAGDVRARLATAGSPGGVESRAGEGGSLVTVRVPRSAR